MPNGQSTKLASTATQTVWLKRFLSSRNSLPRIPIFWVKEFGYVPKGKAGQKSKHYITFTSKIIGPALEQLTGERPVFDLKYTTARRDMTMSIRAIFGWQDPSQIKIPNPNRKCRRLPIDDEMCECGDITDVGEEPDYDLETLKLMTTIAAVAEKAAALKAKRSKLAAIDKKPI